MEIVFYRASKGNTADKVIAWWTSPFSSKFSGDWRDSYSHVEIILPTGFMVSASQYKGCVRAKKFKTSTSWHSLEVPMGRSMADATEKFILSKVGIKYDYIGLLGFVFGTRDVDSKYFCSELIAEALMEGGVLPKSNPAKFSPNTLYLELKKGLV